MTDPAGLVWALPRVSVTDGTWTKGRGHVPRRYPWTAFHAESSVPSCLRALSTITSNLSPGPRGGLLFMEPWPPPFSSSFPWANLFSLHSS